MIALWVSYRIECTYRIYFSFVIRKARNKRTIVLICKTYIKNITKKNWEVPTTLPINKPTAKLLWNFRITIVPPTLREIITIASHMVAKLTRIPRLATAQKIMRPNRRATNNIAYLFLICRWSGSWKRKVFNIFMDV